MIRLLILPCILSFSINAFSQNSANTKEPSGKPATKPFTGANTGGSYKLIIDKDPKLKKDELPYGDLDIDKILPQKLEFMIDYNSGAPDYHIASIGGVAESTDGKTYNFTQQLEFPEGPCEITFILKSKKNILVQMKSDVSYCGFGAFANPEGTYVMYFNE